jgi:hypothetical protein
MLSCKESAQVGRDDPAMIECEQGQHITVCTTVQTVHSLLLITAPATMIGGPQFRPSADPIVPGHGIKPFCPKIKA